MGCQFAEQFTNVCLMCTGACMPAVHCSLCVHQLFILLCMEWYDLGGCRTCTFGTETLVQTLHIALIPMIGIIIAIIIIELKLSCDLCNRCQQQVLEYRWALEVRSQVPYWMKMDIENHFTISIIFDGAGISNFGWTEDCNYRRNFYLSFSI